MNTLLLGYEILGELGRGGMGVVYRARQSNLNREVALKMILAGGQASDEERVRFLAEAEAIASIQHPGILQIYEFGTHDGRPYCALEYCPHGSLADKLGGAPLMPREAARVVELTARGVQAAHEKGILHRDLKPGNILLDAAGQPKVADFGLARKLEGGPGLTQTGAVVGTPSYMPPEQAVGKKELGATADVYSLGAILYECLTGRPPFRAATAYDTIVQVVNEDPLSPRALNGKVPPDLETICLTCLRKEASQRYASARELEQDLRRGQAGEPILARPTGRIERAWKLVRRRPLISGLVAATALAMVLGSAVSAYFAWSAQEQAKLALDREEVATEALNRVEQSLAEGLLRPLGHFEDEQQLNDFELAALTELASLPFENDPVRVLFITKALEKIGTAGQLGRRLEEALVAAVGLRQDLRVRVGEIFGKRMEANGTPKEIKLVCARGIAQLGCTDADLAEAALLVLIAAIEEGNTIGEQSLSQTAEKLCPAIATKRIPAIVRKILDVATMQTEKRVVKAGSDFKEVVVAVRVSAIVKKHLTLPLECLGNRLYKEDRTRLFGEIVLDGPETEVVNAKIMARIEKYSNRELLDVLKRPSKELRLRAVAVKALGHRFKRTFRDVWELRKYVEQHHPDLAPANPLGEYRLITRATNRNRGTAPSPSPDDPSGGAPKRDEANEGFMPSMFGD